MADYVEESGIDPDINTNIDRDRWDGDQILNQVAVDRNNDGEPDALAICNPDGTAMNENNGFFYTDDTILPLTQIYQKINFGFKAKTISVCCSDRPITLSLDGAETHCVLASGESFTWENIGRLFIWIKKNQTQATTYKLSAY